MKSVPEDELAAYPLGPALDFMRRIAELNHALERVSSRMDRTLGVTAQQRLILRCVGKYPGITAGQLATILHLDPGTISASLRRLVERRLVDRRDDPRDKRRVVLGLTPEGRDLDRPTAGTVEDAVQRLLDTTDETDMARAATVLTKLSHLLERSCEGTPMPEPR
ncbi:MAG: winged helix-turn-helix transcriptional regulator [Deltaproteobacteria bacterium]|nr:winged helix-turn-helix transcriptional regulator [Deltaproteobacteria bacterium]